MALPFLLLRIGRPGVAAGIRSLFAFWAGGGAVAETEVIEPPVSVGGGYWRPYRQPVAVEGVGYAILPQVEGEAHGLVVAAGAGDIKGLPVLAGTSVGTVSVVGRSVARLALKAAAVGDRGQAGAARAVLKGLSVAGAGAGGANCTGARAIIGLQGAAIGRHDDDEAAIMALLLAAA